MHVIGIFDTLKMSREVTLIMVMNKFESVFEFDRALVLNKGRIVENAPVKDLLKSEKSEFSVFVQKSDPFIFENLQENLAKMIKEDRRQRENRSSNGDSFYLTDISARQIDEKVFFNDLKTK